MESLSLSSLHACLHCGKEFSGTARFCCSGCEMVFGLLESKGLMSYYELRKDSEAKGQSSFKGSLIPAELKEDLSWLDQDPTKTQTEFYLEGIHCAACLWLIERMPEWVPGVEWARLDFGRSLVKIQRSPQGSFVEIAKRLAQIGYRPHPIVFAEDQERLELKERRSEVIRLGVAAACAANIMLMAVPLYGGATGAIGRLFEVLSFFLFLPSVTYCSLPFYRNILAALKQRSFSIDLSVYLAIWAGFGVSTWNLYWGEAHLYFDSLSSLVFLLLASRLFLTGLQKKVLDHTGILAFFAPPFVTRIAELGKKERIKIADLQLGERIEVGQEQKIPADGISTTATWVEEAALTGEFKPRKIVPGDPVYAGTLNQGPILILDVTAIGEQTRLGKILSQIQSHSYLKAPIVSFADRISKYFIFGVIVLAVGVVVAGYVQHGVPGLEVAISRALTLMIVTCPCALAFSIPLTFGLALASAAKKGVLLKSPEVLERLTRIKEVFLDKTGTLTEGAMRLLEARELMPCRDWRRLVLSLELDSAHPIGKALVQELKALGVSALPVKDFLETPGVGVSGVIDGQRVEVVGAGLKSASSFFGAAPNVKEVGVGQAKDLLTEVILRVDGVDSVLIGLGDRLRAESMSEVARLKKRHDSVWLLSGDAEAPVIEVARLVGIPPERAGYRQTPEQKKSRVEGKTGTLMVGDGANDAIALSAADVGVAVQGSVEVSLRAADVYLSIPGIGTIVSLIEGAHHTLRTIHINFAFSFFYNLLGGALALTGVISPLVAAVLMPLSSFTVILTSWLRNRNMFSKP